MNSTTEVAQVHHRLRGRFSRFTIGALEEKYLFTIGALEENYLFTIGALEENYLFTIEILKLSNVTKLSNAV